MMGLIPRPLRKYLTILWQRYRGDITIVPYASLSDYASILSNPSEFSPRVCGRSSRTNTLCAFDNVDRWKG